MAREYPSKKFLAHERVAARATGRNKSVAWLQGSNAEISKVAELKSESLCVLRDLRV
jgi:hypothetical protein